LVRHSGDNAPAKSSSSGPSDGCQWDGPAVLLARRQANLARGAKVEEHAMSRQWSTTIAVIDVGIGKNSFHVVGRDRRGAIVLRRAAPVPTGGRANGWNNGLRSAQPILPNCDARK